MSMTATAAIIKEPGGEFTFETIEFDDLRQDELFVRIEASGVCHTDIHAQHIVPMPAVMGHEGTGIVEKIGSGVHRVKVGDRVVISYGWCGECPNCKQGDMHICDEDVRINFGGSRLDGTKPVKLNGESISSAFFQQSSFATFAVTPERNVVVIEQDLSACMRAALPCGVLTGAGAIMNTFKPGVKDSLVIAGAGTVGLSAVMAAKLSGAFPLIVVDVVESRLQLALELGATHVINGKTGDVAKQILDISPRGVKFAFDTTSNEHVVNSLIGSLAMGGHLGLVTPPRMGEVYPFPLTDLFLRAGHLEGIFFGSSNPAIMLPKIIELNQEGLFPYEQLITEYDFQDINKAIADSKYGTAIKPVLKML